MLDERGKIGSFEICRSFGYRISADSQMRCIVCLEKPNICIGDVDFDVLSREELQSFASSDGERST
jgi:hypothetical protein